MNSLLKMLFIKIHKKKRNTKLKHNKIVGNKKKKRIKLCVLNCMYK